MTKDSQNGKRWTALGVLCLGVLMIVLDSTIVNVALPSIKDSLQFTENRLVWVVNAYLLTFGGFLLLGGRLGDLYGHRRVFLFGIAAFTLASLVCGLAQTQEQLILARAVQGVAGAVVDAVSLSLIMNLFPEQGDRAKAMGVYGFVCAGGGSIGVVLGGLLTSSMSWHWIFLVNVPIGFGVLWLCWYLISGSPPATEKVRLDVAGAVAVTTASMIAVYGIVNVNAAGWLSLQTLGALGASLLLLATFLWIEQRASAPLMPLSLFKSRNVSTANVVAVLWAAGLFAWFFMSALYLQFVWRYDPMQVGLAFLPANIVMAAFSLGLSAKIVMRFGVKWPLSFGLTVAAAGLGLLAFMPVDGEFTVHVLPGFLLLGVGLGLAFNPLLLAAMGDVAPNESGLASGLINTAFMLGGALGLAMLASLSAARTQSLIDTGAIDVSAVSSGYRLAFGIGATMIALAAIVAATRLRVSNTAGVPMAHGA